jgi:O-antigen/teichoic acid export membrane protein
MLRDFLKEGSIITLASVATKGVSLLLIPFYSAYFSTTDYGILDTLTVFGGFVNAILSLQIGQGVGRYLADERLSEEEKKKISSTGINLIILFYLAGTGILIATATFWTNWLEENEEITNTIFRLSIASIAINALFYQLGINLRFKRKTKLFALTNFLHALLNIALTYVFVSQWQIGIEGIFYASLAVAPLIVIMQFVFARNDYRLFIGRDETMKLLRFSVPLIPAAIAYIILELIDRFFLKNYFGFSEVGVYGMGARFSSVLYLIITGFSMALAPLVYEKHSQDITKRKLNKLIRYYFLLGTVSVLLLGLFSFETLYLFTNEKWYEARYVMPLLYSSVFFSGLGMFSVGVHLSGKTWYSSAVVIASALLNVILNFMLIPEYGSLGAGISTLISMWFNGIIFYYISSRFYFFCSPKKILLFSTLFMICAFGIVVFEMLPVDYPVLLVSKLAIAILALTLTFVVHKRLGMHEKN